MMKSLFLYVYVAKYLRKVNVKVIKLRTSFYSEISCSEKVWRDIWDENIFKKVT